MRTFLSIAAFAILTSCNSSGSEIGKDVQIERPTIDTAKIYIENTIARSSDTTISPKSTLANLRVLVLPPFDSIANRGISPNLQKYIEDIFTTDTTFRLLKFPYRRLMNVSYQNVFDKKYCSPITDKIETVIIIMSKLDQATGTGNMTKDKWNFKIKIYDTRTNVEKLSKLSTNDLTSYQISNLITSRRQELFRETRNNR
jgi:hypothetical protein